MKNILTTTIVVFALTTTAFAQTGSVDFTFDSEIGANNTVWTTSIQDDGKIIIGGDFTTYNGTARNHIARLHVDGTLDTSFDPGTGANLTIRTTSIQSDGKILIGGTFTMFNGIAKSRIARLNVDGTIDTTFVQGTGASDGVYSIAIQNDDQIIIGGWFTSYNGTPRNKIARLNLDGTIDNTFNPGTGADLAVLTTSILNEGQIIVGGAFTSYNGSARNRIARLNEDGSLDLSFDPGIGADNWIWTTSIQSDGKIVAGGLFTYYDGSSRNKIARLNVDGSLDGSFNPGSGANNDVFTSSVQSDGQIIIGGWFSSYNGTARNRITRLNVDGSLDDSFDPGSGANDIIWTIALQSDEQIIVGGQFTGYDGIERNRIVRLQSLTTGINDLNPAADHIKLFPNPTRGALTLQADILSGALVYVYNTAGQLVIQEIIGIGNSLMLDLSNQASGLYTIEVKQPAYSSRFKVSKQ